MKRFTMAVGALMLLSPTLSQAMYQPPFPGPQPGGVSTRIRLFRAHAYQSCWAKEVIGYSCYVQGTGYTDCQQARWALQSMSQCCRDHMHNGKRVTNGSSIGLSGFSCTNW